MTQSSFLIPPSPLNEESRTRTAGFEFELGGLSLEQTCDAVVAVYGGEVRKQSTFEYAVQTEVGVFSVEIDSGVLTKKKYTKPLELAGMDLQSILSEKLETSLLQMFSYIVPVEIGTPPLPLDSLESLIRLEDGLRARGAKGTQAGLLYAFGLHINPELAERSVSCICRTMQAFLLLYPWLQQEVQVDLARRVTPFINAFPKKYMMLILNESYHPDIGQFIDDYLEHNNTRNRPLDLLPVLAYFDEERVRKIVGSEHKIKKRPTFHYRMPNCLIDQAAWSSATEWNRWVAVEQLAADGRKVQELIGEYKETQSASIFSSSWAEVIQQTMER